MNNLEMFNTAAMAGGMLIVIVALAHKAFASRTAVKHAATFKSDFDYTAHGLGDQADVLTLKKRERSR
ncbi:hypothetical protein [Caulobacter sp. NIBR2454]|uniref:hypothetical protein n=1 Tax=Caulobacter sp. NIBR2454 TaxID=3015996 RepID=UPI0022B6205A|nr:hypothetical protein [Caulobacter sp. NIBR2454]